MMKGADGEGELANWTTQAANDRQESTSGCSDTNDDPDNMPTFKMTLGSDASQSTDTDDIPEFGNGGGFTDSERSAMARWISYHTPADWHGKTRQERWQPFVDEVAGYYQLSPGVY